MSNRMDLHKLGFLQVLLLSALGLCAGQQALPPGVRHGAVGGNITFTTTIDPSAGQEFLTISWTFNGAPIVTLTPKVESPSEAYKGRVTLNKTTGSLQLRQLTSSDSGDYAVSMVTQEAKTIAGEATLKVFEPVSDVTVQANATEKPIVEFNDTVSLTCSATGSDLSYQWLAGASVIASGDRMRLSDKNRTLTISGILRSDQGPFTCTASNVIMAKRSKPILLIVSYGPENVKMTVTPQKPIHKTGSNLTLTCSVESSPPAVIGWVFNGTPLKQEGPVLQLANILESQSGNYSCMSHNTVTLRYKPSETSRISVLEGISGSKIIGPTTSLIAGNSTANMSCQAVSGTVASREWLKDGKPLSPSDRITIAADKSSVSITPVQSSDSGDYVCQLFNAVNSETASYKMTVNYGPQDVKIKGEEAVEMGDKVVLMCSAKSLPPATFSWTFNGTLLRVTNAEYIIDSAVYGQSGRYACMAKNNVTGLSLSAVHTLSVKEEGALEEEETLSGGAIAGIVIAILVAVGIIAAVVYYMRTNRKIESPY
ncbi:carcinoembryonic antigen-related cell adhesion molecule 5-like [Megalops cyprinoides]|uniref:carcinoembryonic antigen-related cell adhesion molecule 5-like n=1 Tax=Megalops cyprinoides TaxID=118141 RepID=UPI0018647530|nr:carcinoembryonic antigen-related cell adhesion molecule 5-like [Megalops cyprinoides]